MNVDAAAQERLQPRGVSIERNVRGADTGLALEHQWCEIADDACAR